MSNIGPINRDYNNPPSVDWKNILLNGVYRGHAVMRMADALYQKDSSHLQFDSKNNTISNGEYVLNLGEITSTDNTTTRDTIAHSWHEFKLSVSDSYRQENEAKITHLANLIGKKVAETQQARKTELEKQLFIAVISCDKQQIDALLKSGVNVNCTMDSGRTPLFVAALQNNTEITKLLLEANANPNIVDRNGSTPLLEAIEKGGVPLVKLLIASGANINQPDSSGVTPVQLAIFIKHPEILQLLIRAKANVNEINEIGISHLDYLKIADSKEGRELALLIKEASPGLQNRTTEIKHRKIVSHAWHLEHMSPVKSSHPDISPSIVKLEGASHGMMWRKMEKSLPEFKTAYPGLLEEHSALDELLHFSANQNQYSSAEILERIQTGLPTFINTGYARHAVTLLIWKDHFVVCNRGAVSASPADFNHINPQGLTVEIIDKIRDINRSQDAYVDLFFEELPEKLDLTVNRKLLDDKLESEASPLPEQTLGNCSWISPITGVYAYLALSGILGEENGKILDRPQANFEDTLKDKVHLYRTWLGFEQVSSLEKLISRIEKSSIVPDHALIQSALRKAYFLNLDQDKVLQQKLFNLTDRYMSALNEEKKSEFKTNLEMWKMQAEQLPASAREIRL